MSALQNILGKDDQFYDLLEAGAVEARSSIQTLAKHVRSADSISTLDEFAAVRRKEKLISIQIGDAICTNFATSMDRDDIEALAYALHKIPKTVSMIAERLSLAPQHLQGADFEPQLAMLEKAGDTVYAMVQMLRKEPKPEQIKPLNDQLQFIEGEADKFVTTFLRSFYAGQTDLMKAIFLKDFVELLEKVTDRCRDAGNVISHIVLKRA